MQEKLEALVSQRFARERLLDRLSKVDGRAMYQMFGHIDGARQDDKAASLALNEVGVKGITYDGRRDGRCFVIFDDKAIEIIEKYNQEAFRRMAAEKEAVRRRYEGRPAWMKAPNGAPTNLSLDQWLMVWTPSFQAVFGDWEQVADAVPRIKVGDVRRRRRFSIVSAISRSKISRRGLWHRSVSVGAVS